MSVREHYRVVEVHDVVVDSSWGSHQFRIEILQNLLAKAAFHYRVYISLELTACNVVENGFPEGCFRSISVWVKFHEFPESHNPRSTAEETLQEALRVCESSDLTISFPDRNRA